ncbi:hypothetical protein IRJ41_015969 [Triplophysa rosa]|uniref:THAP domain-containing protein 1 n=1 Tax=Triplophysa rosa TaxID=992332 RepID=A0A9W7TKC9_TRIRA|nr:hypothetical protein IRJ41_015969 [Triplophysa rosa]
MSCCAVGCQNRKSVNSGLKFYRIPSTCTPFNANRRRLWIQAIRRADWKEDQIKNARLCSSHFISGEVSMDFNSPDFVPSVFSYSTHCEINKGDAKLESFELGNHEIVCLGHDHTEQSCTHQETCTLLTFPGYIQLECRSGNYISLATGCLAI